MRRDLHPLRFTFFEIPSHLIHGVRAPDRYWSVVPGQAAAHKRHCYIDECEVHQVTPNVIDQHGALGNTQRLIRELRDLLRLEMVSEQRTPDAINGRVGKGKPESIPGDCGDSGSEMREGPI